MNKALDHNPNYSSSPLRILITGASGFIGSHMVEQALQCGYETWAGIRSSSSQRYLNDERTRFITLDLTSPTILREQLLDHRNTYGTWDVIIHCAGATKCRNKKDFDIINYLGTKYLIETLAQLQMTPQQFIYMSTLGTFGPIHEQLPYTPIRESDTPHPNTFYGLSKLKAEQYIKSVPDFPYVIFRPTGVYGPRDKDYSILINSIRHHIELLLGSKPQAITFVYIKDLVQAVFSAIKHRVSHRSYFVTDGHIYNSRDFGAEVLNAFERRRVIRITVPLWMGHLCAKGADLIGYATHRHPTFNSDKYHILKQRNWSCDIKPLIEELDYQPQYNLHQGIKELLRT